MGKTIVLNLNHINIKGDVLDVGESFGVIYNIAKDIDDEVSVDYIEEENSEVLKERSYDNCTIFFALSNIWGDSQRERLLQKISRSIKTGGSIYIWDINKERGIVFFIILLILIVLSFVIDIIISHKIYKNVTSKYADILTVVNVLTLGLTRPIILFIIRNKYSKETK